MRLLDTKLILEAKQAGPWTQAATTYLTQNPSAGNKEVYSHTHGLGLDKPNNPPSVLARIRKNLKIVTPRSAQKAAATAAPSGAPAAPAAPATGAVPATGAAPATGAPGPNVLKEPTGSDEIHKWMKAHGIDPVGDDVSYTINESGVIDASGFLMFTDLNVSKLPHKFGTVTDGIFEVAGAGLTTLVGCPDQIIVSADIGVADFWAADNKISNLEGCPTRVDGDVVLSTNTELRSLEGITSEIGGDLHIDGLTKLTTLTGIHKMVQKMDGSIKLDGTPIVEDVLGLLYITGLMDVHVDESNPKLSKAIELVNKYLIKVQKGISRPGIAMADCAEEMYENDLEDFAGK